VKTFAGRKLSRPTGPRQALLKSLASHLLRHESIRTTLPKARELSRFTDSLLAEAKRKTLTSYRRIGAAVPDRELRRKLYDVLVPRYQSRAGGCTRVFRLGRRLGDNAEVALIKLVQ
jgi:large subunit ribosomal protein L17